MLDERERLCGPRRVQISAQRVLVFEHLIAREVWVLSPRHDDENGGGFPAGRGPVSPAEDERTILPNGFEHTLG